jgi:hypothetical protein
MKITAAVLQKADLVISGAPGLTIRTGTIGLTHSTAGDDWEHGQLDEVVFELPNSPPGRIVHAVATAAPASIGYWPPRLDLSPADLHAAGRVGGSLANLKVISLSGVRPVLPAAAWAVEKTEVVHDLNVVRLVVDIAVWGPTTLMRIAYSVFVMTMPLTETNATTHAFPHL